MQIQEADGLVPIHHNPAPLRTRIIESMRSAIERGILKPGERLVEKDLCDRLGVSRTSLREALRELESEGIVASVTARGLTVVRLSYRDAENIYRIRADIEALIMEQFIERADDAALKTLLDLCDHTIACYEAGDFVPIVDAKRQLYLHLCTVAENMVAHEILSKLTLRTAQLRRGSVTRPARQEQSIREMRDLKAAIAARDVDGARRAARSHVESAARSALEFARTRSA
ncbi:GntR family transcriptional regulator [Halovulum dunhuangense]|uniref:GntR family transcriptional regulator n=1 Tax=Halovulum dunhuangense TaxID=1505036 RepID=A0A849L3A3_9RHOB|nr:GntR family transcriptional regulator [Halovulum dunhuangense]NNU80789.1 GntR family transcriptional regulator [Halovulum dunhuangense]